MVCFVNMISFSSGDLLIGRISVFNISAEVILGSFGLSYIINKVLCTQKHKQEISELVSDFLILYR